MPIAGILTLSGSVLEKVSMGVVRTTYLIDENGVIAKAMDKVKAADNPAQMLETLKRNAD